MWAWGFLVQRLLPSVVAMLTTYLVVLGAIALFRVKSRNARIALFTLPLYKSLSALVMGVPRIELDKPVPVFVSLKLPDVDQLRFLPGKTPDLFFQRFGPSVGNTFAASWGSVFNWVLAMLAVAACAVIVNRLVGFLVFYRRVSIGPDMADAAILRGTPRRAAKTMNIGVPRVVLIEADQSFVPFTMGWRRPVVVLPRRLLDAELLSDEELESVLAHEFAHIKRRDYLLNWVFSLADTLLFFNPLAKRVVSRAYEAAEEACDGLAVRTTRQPKALVDALVRIARETRESATGGVRKLDPRTVPQTVQAYTNTLMSGQRLKQRIVRIESGEASRQPPGWLRRSKTVPVAIFVAMYAVIQINIAIPIGGGLLFFQ